MTGTGICSALQGVGRESGDRAAVALCARRQVRFRVRVKGPENEKSTSLEVVFRESRTEPTFSFGKIGGGGLVAASRAGVALRSTSRTSCPSRNIVNTRVRHSLTSFFLISVTHFAKTVINCFCSFPHAPPCVALGAVFDPSRTGHQPTKRKKPPLLRWFFVG